MIGARTVQPIINPSIALYVKRNEKVEKIDKEMQSLLTRTSNWDRSIIKHSHQQQMDIIAQRNNFLFRNKNKNSLRKDLDINESVMISSSSDIELLNKETHAIFQYNRRDCQGQNITHIFPTAIMNIGSKAPQVIYASRRKPTNRDRKRKHVSRQTIFGMHCKNDSIRKNIF
ncbi:uncharacterized protein LOC107263099 isoform X2 [Cephus cinctus]|nr:uncharacterized protein LOC107263099 isoform X2 [Cephus cinctus]